MKREHAGRVIGAIAHETDHIAAVQSARGLVAFLGVLEDRDLPPPNRHQWLAAPVATTSTVAWVFLGPKEHSTCANFT